MKLTSRLLFALSIFILVGCLNNKSSNESVPTDTIAKTPDFFADSVAAAKKAEAEKEAAIEKENIQRKLDDAGVLIYNYTRSLAKQIDELTHQKEDYSIDTAKISYNKYTKLVTIPFTASWLGAVYYTTGENPLKLHELKADLLLYADGTYKIKPTWLNEDLATDIKETNSMLDGLEKLNKIGEAFSDHSSNPETN